VSAEEVTLSRGRRPWVVGVTGASGTPYAAAVIRGLIAAGEAVDLVVTQAARLTIFDETGVRLRDGSWRESVEAWCGPLDGDVRYWRSSDFAAGPSSGSYRTKGMVVVPASSASVAGIALGLSKDLVQRAAEVALKERRPLIVVPRETPLTRSMLVRMTELIDAGAVVMPANPAFYGGPTSLQDLVDFFAGRVLDQMGIERELHGRWEGRLGATREEPSDDIESLLVRDEL
jgi:4-hydroxy-3-polyprenylbenzoate decarboxylase